MVWMLQQPTKVMKYNLLKIIKSTFDNDNMIVIWKSYIFRDIATIYKKTYDNVYHVAFVF